ncbi:stalk domain-containing protein [Paenibacillus sp. JSM ZJ436]|uniref:stalk domain-containing protein n=1 Tax=Paenibacillus sp. JSM ZJ436 TaxID=3376190 RepID=UPI0037964295
MFKKRIGLLVAALLLLLGSTVQPAPAHAQSSVTVLLDGKAVSFQSAPVIKNGVTFVPFRPLFEALGYKVSWSSASKKVTGSFLDQQLEMKAGSTQVSVNGKTTALQAAPYIAGGSTLVPLRFVAESTGYPVKWDAKSRNILIDRQSAFAKASVEIKKLYADMAAAVTRGDYKAALTAIHPNSPHINSYIMSYDNMATRSGKQSAYVSDVQVIGSVAVAKVVKTQVRTGGPFDWDYTIAKQMILKPDAAGAWKEYDSLNDEVFVHVPDGLIEARPAVDAAAKLALENVLKQYTQAFNQKDLKAVRSFVVSDSPYDYEVVTAAEEGFFQLDFTLESVPVAVVHYDEQDAVLLVNEIFDEDGEKSAAELLYWFKQESGTWRIAEVLFVEEE